MLKTTQITSSISIIHGSVNCGFIRDGSCAILIDCCDTINRSKLAELGIDEVEMILFTQYRRPNTCGAYHFLSGNTSFLVPDGERKYFEQNKQYWNAWENRWHVYTHQPGPMVPIEPIPVSTTIHQNDQIEWHGFVISAQETPGTTDGAVSYWVETENIRICFCGDTIYANGKLWDLYSLQKGKGNIMDYHGFLGNRDKLLNSLEKIRASSPDILVPSHGPIIQSPAQDIERLTRNLENLWKNYISTSSLNHYFPGFLTDPEEPSSRIEPGQSHEIPTYIKRVAYTSFALIAEDRSALLIDCGHDTVIDQLQNWLERGIIRSVEGCWITHYHDDHVDSLGRIHQAFHCPVYTEEHMTEILEHPVRFFLPCISPNRAKVTKSFNDGASWQWHEFKLTAYHFPGQTYYHSGLLVEKTDTINTHNVPERVFFAGDSGSPTGIDDHCPGNRNFTGKGKGFRQCLEIWKQTKPDHILNEHQDRSFSFTIDQLDEMDRILDAREKILQEILPWDDPNFGLDENWIRTYPYQQEAFPGSKIAIDIQITNHLDCLTEVKLEPVLLVGWEWIKPTNQVFQVKPNTCGTTLNTQPNPDTIIRLWINIPKNTPSDLYVIPFRTTWNQVYLGQFRHALVVIRNNGSLITTQ